MKKPKTEIWRPKKGEPYYYMHFAKAQTEYIESSFDAERFKEGNCFKNVEDLEALVSTFKTYIKNHE